MTTTHDTALELDDKLEIDISEELVGKLKKYRNRIGFKKMLVDNTGIDGRTIDGYIETGVGQYGKVKQLAMVVANYEKAAAQASAA